MSGALRFSIPLSRDQLTDFLGSPGSLAYPEAWTDESDESFLPEPGDIRLGQWDTEADDRPSIILCRDGEQREVLAWLGTYFPALAPLSAWCHVLTPTSLRTATLVSIKPFSSFEAHLWANVVIGEVYSLLRDAGELATVSLAAPLSSETYAYARCRSVWRGKTDAANVARRWGEFAPNFGSSPRKVGHQQLREVWHAIDQALGGEELAKSSSELLLAGAVEQLAKTGDIDDVFWRHLGEAAGVRQLGRLPMGSQQEKLRAFDAIALQLNGADNSVADFLIGIAASMVTGGKMQNIDLLEPLLEKRPATPLWYALHSALTSRAAVGSEFRGFARQVAKELMRPFDLRQPPVCDVSLDELVTLVRDRSDQSGVVRSLSRRVIQVDVAPGVTTAWSVTSPREREARASSPRYSGEQSAEPRGPGALATKEALLAIDQAKQLLIKASRYIGSKDSDAPVDQGGQEEAMPQKRKKKGTAKAGYLF